MTFTAMKLKIMGSSGAHPFPKVGCTCKDCEKAKVKGIPYERISSSMFVFPDILIDTPEEIFRRMIKFDINELKHVFFTHWHPDHTQGLRLFGLWTRSGMIGVPQKPPIKVYMPPDMIHDFDEHLPHWRFYENRKYFELIEVKDREPIKIGDKTFTYVNFNRDDRIRYGVLIEQDGKRVMYASCSVYETKFDKFWENLDLLILETGWPGPTKEGREKPIQSWYPSHISLKEDFEWQKKLGAKKLLLTHIPASVHMTYDWLKAETDKHENADVAFDGMEIVL